MIGANIVSSTMTLAAVDALIRDSEVWVKEEMGRFDASHDYMHAFRVRRNALAIAEREGLQGDSLTVVHLAALMHDVRDHKYSDEGASDAIKVFLEGKGMAQDVIERICYVVDHVSFTKEMRGEKKQSKHGEMGEAELACVQDADRLDAIGAVGIARCFTFGGAKLRPLYNPALCDSDLVRTEEEKASESQGDGARALFWGKGSEGSSILHFYEKLLKLKDMMKTEAGRKLAEERHACMVEFLTAFEGEVISGTAQRDGDVKGKRKREAEDK